MVTDKVLCIAQVLICALTSTAEATYGADLRQLASAGSTQLAEVNLPSMTLTEALFRVGKQSGRCIGLVFVTKAIPMPETAAIAVKEITLNQLLTALLEKAKALGVYEGDGCVVVSPRGDDRSYLTTIIPRFKVSRGSLDYEAYLLARALIAAKMTKAQLAASQKVGTVSSIGENSDSPEIGPFDEIGKPVETILCEMATRAGQTMWIALPQKPEITQPWRFLRYKEPDELSKSRLLSIAKELSEGH